jgi:hypothetical protein
MGWRQVFAWWSDDRDVQSFFFCSDHSVDRGAVPMLVACSIFDATTRETNAMSTSMSENIISRAAIDRTAIERWEGEGGRASALELDEESQRARSGSEPRKGIPQGKRAQERSVRERAPRSTS